MTNYAPTSCVLKNVRLEDKDLKSEDKDKDLRLEDFTRDCLGCKSCTLQMFRLTYLLTRTNDL